MSEPLIFEKSSAKRKGVSIPKPDCPETNPPDVISKEFLRDDIKGFPEVSEVDTVRHWTRLSQWNFGVDSGFYPLGSCTMKYNPKINEDTARLAGFSKAHPYQSDELSQGALQLMYELEGFLCEISGMDTVTLQPAAGAHGELCGMLMIAQYFKEKGKPRKKVIIPDTAHGTNPASSHLAGFSVVSIKEENGGVITPDVVAAAMDEDTAALMLTNPNTLGLFELNIKEIADIVHKKGGFIYCDGANLNALMGIAKLGEMGVDVIQFNLHKTFSTPHGGGGPGSGPVGVEKSLEPFLPKPRIIKKGKRFSLDYNRPKSIGRLKAFYGNFAIMLRAYSYIRAMGADGLKKASEMAVLNANYIKEKLKGHYYLPYDQTCMHESVFSDKLQAESDVHTLDIAKRLIDYGFHPPTIYFPLIVPGAIMIEPTETETKEVLDEFIGAMIKIAKEAKDNPDIVKNAPHTTRVSRLDEARAARSPVLRWKG
ncbi:MAG: glycine dehydrogenase (aminomethyl-transferring) [Deltaproteobacteria bacterium RIFCSPLOWO2_12_FULL_43_16]|nr:MAG: glycine dehydrogenase (aminomethyl-transferring) [Deltaproteobacteria bacterium GWA2_43_19]OGQ09278.1 MAG: glycine dehydrogenase (aminomethyl-transferring) [Deltaproteobacteria bacterium RIFCSPHIGHO2_02_FULL_43_33]OGQ57870.1 MAG: glycine dehydrogenase (aminomethyl-transferring) [Deltaproteobacteria bacterium RIFCSPLOWO2_12_FULL_43_16]HBR18163.1 aminomethyl-transferring glycine dehydrogenase subunit GcvPB [Deltaproteobacteria bacterium]